MKSRTKAALIFLAILAAVFLAALLDGSGIQSAGEEEEEGALIGAFVSEETIDTGDDLEVTAEGKFRWKQGRLYAEELQKCWHIPDLPDGGGIYCAMRTETEGVLTGEKAPVVVNVGSLGMAKGLVSVNDDGGIRTTDVTLSGEVYACGGADRVFHFYPIYQMPDGRIYLTRGSSFGTSGAGDGESMTFTSSSDKTVTADGNSERTRTEVKITAVMRPTPVKTVVLHMDENDNVLAREEYAPDVLPGRIKAARGSAYLLIGSVGRSAEGAETTDFSMAEPARSSEGASTYALKNGALRLHNIFVDWEDAA